MEPVLATLLVVSLVFGGSEWLQNKGLEKDVSELKVELTQADNELQKALRVNENNVEFIDKIVISNNELLASNKKLREDQRVYDEINATNELVIKELEAELVGDQWGDTRIPDKFLHYLPDN